MNLSLTTSILLGGAVLAALASVLGMVSAVQITARRDRGYFHWAFYGIAFISAFIVLVSNRDLTSVFLENELPGTDTVRHPLVAIFQPLVSLLVLTVSGERIITRWLRRKTMPAPPGLLLLAFVVFWTGTVALPALFGANPLISHDYAYPLVIGIAAVLATGIERDKAMQAARDSMMLLMAASLLLIPFEPAMVLDNAYGQGLLPGVPRLGGLAQHAVAMGLLSQLGLLCLQASPYRHAWLNRLAWVVGLAALLMAQSKTAWIAFVVSSLCLIAFRSGPNLWRRISDPKNPALGVLSLLLAITGLIALGGTLVFSDLGGRIGDYMATSEGAELASLTGRDKIWLIAYDEWERNPIFGYGPTLWNAEFRASIGVAHATHGHNQFMDTLSRSGSVGAASLVIYAVVLLVLSIRYTVHSRGLSLALFLAIAMRAISEVPLALFGYNLELITQALLLTVLAGCAVEVAVKNRLLADSRRYAPPSRKSVTPLAARSIP